MLIKLLASFLFIGYCPIAPGTMASLVTVIIFYLLKPSLVGHLIIILVFTILGVVSAKRCEDHWGRDNSKIVIDEFVGQAIALIAVPFTLLNMVACFLLFRFFDILKPPPIRNLERSLTGGFAVVFDDVLAGVFANICMQVALIVFIGV